MLFRSGKLFYEKINDLSCIDLYCRIINPGDGIAQAIADCIHRSVGFTKNCFDVLNVTITIVISLVCTGRLHGIGIGACRDSCRAYDCGL